MPPGPVSWSTGNGEQRSMEHS